MCRSFIGDSFGAASDRICRRCFLPLGSSATKHTPNTYNAWVSLQDSETSLLPFCLHLLHGCFSMGYRICPSSMGEVFARATLFRLFFSSSPLIHDNFMSVRNTARRLHRNQVPTLFFKLDIIKAFDSVR